MKKKKKNLSVNLFITKKRNSYDSHHLLHLSVYLPLRQMQSRERKVNTKIFFFFNDFFENDREVKKKKIETDVSRKLPVKSHIDL